MGTKQTNVLQFTRQFYCEKCQHVMDNPLQPCTNPACKASPPPAGRAVLSIPLPNNGRFCFVSEGLPASEESRAFRLAEDLQSLITKPSGKWSITRAQSLVDEIIAVCSLGTLPALEKTLADLAEQRSLFRRANRTFAAAQKTGEMNELRQKIRSIKKYQKTAAEGGTK